MSSSNVVPADKANERFKELGGSVYMVSAPVGLAIDEVVRRARRLAKLWRKHRNQPTYLNKLSDLFRDIASLEDAVLKLNEAREK